MNIRQNLHLKAPGNWINDPNGFIYYKGLYHLFYQYNPASPVWDTMHWGHAVSKDLIHWEHLGIAMHPSIYEDADGCFSGSAVENEGKLHLFYTGIRYKDASHTRIESAQIHLASEDGFHFDNKNGKEVILPAFPETEGEGHAWDPENPSLDSLIIGDNADTRDPKVWKGKDGFWYMILGTTAEGRGRVLFFRSRDLENWFFVNSYTGPSEWGWMWECPDLVATQDANVLIFSPMGLITDGHHHTNHAICIPVEFDEKNCTLKNLHHSATAPEPSSETELTPEELAAAQIADQGKYQYLDYGLDLYAPQSTLDAQGRRILTAWLRMPEPAAPDRIKQDDEWKDLTAPWNGMFCLPRVVEVKEGHIFFRMHPQVRDAFRPLPAEEETDASHDPRSTSLQNHMYAFTLSEGQTADLGGYRITLRAGRIFADRSQVYPDYPEFGTLFATPVLKHGCRIEAVVDRNLVELYINDGEYVLSNTVYGLSNVCRFPAGCGLEKYFLKNYEWTEDFFEISRLSAALHPIQFNPQTKVFSLHTDHTVYQMQIKEYDTLVHLYYGADLGDSECTWRFVRRDRGTCANPYEADKDKTFSLDSFLLEYSGTDNGDYRSCALQVRSPGGDRAVNLKYTAHRIYAGKYALNGLPAMFDRGQDAWTLEIDLCDSVSGLKVTLLYGVFPHLDIITRAVRLKNEAEKEPLYLERVLSLQLDYPESNMDLIHFYGRHAMERTPQRNALMHGALTVESTRGASSHQHNPFVILCDSGADEDKGNCYGFSFVYSGNFFCRAGVDQINQTRVMMGIHPQQFCWKLEPGSVFEAPEVVLSYSDQGLALLSNRLHEAFRQALMRSKYVDSPRPILINSWEAAYFTFNEEKLLGIARQAKEIGVDLFVLDDGWFGKREDDTSGLGDWKVNESKLRGGLGALSAQVHGLGMKMGLWVEPEMISEDSDLYRAHPDWCMKIPGRDPVRGRYQLNLDISRPEVRINIMDEICGIIRDCRIDYIKWDFNRTLGNVYSSALDADRQGELLHRYVLGLYDMQERLVSEFPNLLFENCAGGGGRFDAGMLYYSPQIWCSDNTDAIDRLTIQYGTSFGYPISTMGAHVSVVPNHQTGRTTPFATRALVAGAGTFGFELDPEKLTAEEKEQAKEWTQLYRKDEHLVQTGDYYRLSDPTQHPYYALWQLVSKDKTKTVLGGVALRSQANSPISYVHLKGLDLESHYRDEDTGAIYTGAALMRAGLPLPLPEDDYWPFRLCFEKCD